MEVTQLVMSVRSQPWNSPACIHLVSVSLFLKPPPLLYPTIILVKFTKHHIDIFSDIFPLNWLNIFAKGIV